MLGFRNLLRRKVRSALTLIGIAVAVATIVSLIAISRGFRKQFNNLLSVGDAHLVLSRKGAPDPFISYLPESLLSDLSVFPGVAEVYPSILGIAQIPRQPFFFLYGTVAGSPLLEQVRVIAGEELFAPGADQPRLCLGRSAAEYLEQELGSTITLGDQEYEVTGIFEAPTPLLGSGALLPLADAQRIAGLEGKLSEVLVQLESFTPEDLAAAESALEQRFPEVEAIEPAEFTKAFMEFDLADQAVAFFSILAVIVGGIGVMNTMLMSVFERTRELGILQAIGWSKAMILRLVLEEGLLLCLAGGPAGIALGVASIEAVGAWGQFSWVAGDYGPALFVEAMIVAVGMGLLGTFYPALRAVRITPIEALRYE